jgi:metallophosphoesterase (TIGR00282 family)
VLKKVMMIGDVVGEPGLLALEETLPRLIDEYKTDLVVVNGENAAEGFGMTDAALKRILGAGADVVTSGNHIWEKREFWPVLESEMPVLRPANYPAGVPGRGHLIIEKNGARWLVINEQGRELMSAIDCPFKTFDTLFKSAASDSPFIIVDFHAESAAEKEALGFYLDGRAHIVAGTHTHVQTADNRILPNGAAYITDLGMTGVSGSGSIIGMDAAICLERARKQVLYRMQCATGAAFVQGIIAEIDTGGALSIKRLNEKSE